MKLISLNGYLEAEALLRVLDEAVDLVVVDVAVAVRVGALDAPLALVSASGWSASRAAAPRG
jgi:hypothetical protein